MARVRVDATGFCPFATAAFIAVSFHWRTSLAKAGAARARAHRQMTKLAVGTTLPMALRRCIMARSSFVGLMTAT
jgi:hypothetical protein